MDQLVLDALAKWPNVPACTGWLQLDRRGAWRMRDEACQAAGAAGDPIRHPALKAFIERNYESDDQGRWFFQNGPQRVFVDLAYTPYIIRLHFEADTPTLTDQCGGSFVPTACWLDDAGNVLFSKRTPHGGGSADDSGSKVHVGETIALMHDHDLALFAERIMLVDDALGEHVDDDNDIEPPVHAQQMENDGVSWGRHERLPVRQIAQRDVAKNFAFVTSPAI